jgi:alpha-glucosidase
VLIGETGGDAATIAKYYGNNGDEIQLPMDFDYGFVNELSADRFRQALRAAETQLNGNVPLFVFDNHDSRRSWDRYADGLHDDAMARLIATLLLTPRCSALLYYGQEIGMRNNDPKSVDQVLDPVGKVGWPNEIGRDGERTPMQWSAGPNAGFSDAPHTWLPVGPEVETRNVDVESSDPASLLNYYKALIRLRKRNAALNHGDLTLIDETNSNVLSFLRRAGRSTVLVAVNFSATTQTVQLGRTVTTLLASFEVGPARLTDLVLPPFGAYVGEFK